MAELVETHFTMEYMGAGNPCCKTCFALVPWTRQNKHIEWHEELKCKLIGDAAGFSK